MTRDPRDPPPFGALPAVAELDELVDRVIAPNPSPMTLDGTNTMLVGARGSGEVVVVDPGPEDADHLATVGACAAARDAEVVGILLTHHHHDHVEAAPEWAASFGCWVRATQGDLCQGAPPLAAGQTPTIAGTSIEVVATPGHTADHVSFRVATGAILTGDHVLGRGTSVVSHPDGDLAAYLTSLRHVRDLGPHALFPGHGPEMTEDVDQVLAFYLDHRRERLEQVVEVLRSGAATPREVVEVVYAAYDPAVHDAAEASTRAGLAALAAQGRVARQSGGTWRVV